MGNGQKSASLCNRLRGLVPVVPTPLRADETLDIEGVARMAEYTGGYPFSAIWALASAGGRSEPALAGDRTMRPAFRRALRPQAPGVGKDLPTRYAGNHRTHQTHGRLWH